MKKNACKCEGCEVMRPPLLQKILFYMKISALFLLIAIQVSATNFAQEKINLNAKNIAIADVLKSIEGQSSYRFNYSNDILPSEKLISIKAYNADINSVLIRIFQGLALQWKIVENNDIVLSESNNIITRTITGTVRNEKGEPVNGA